MAFKLEVEGAKRGNVFHVPLSKVVVKPGFNTRYGDPDPAEYAALKLRIREEGQRVPARVIPQGDGTVWLVTGHQRYKILNELTAEDGIERMLKCEPFRGNEKDAFFESLSENIRTNLTLMDKVNNWRRMNEVYNMSAQDISDWYGGKPSPATISEGLKLLALSEEEKQQIHKLGLTDAQAKLWVKESDPAKRAAWLERALEIKDERIAAHDARKLSPADQEAQNLAAELSAPDPEDYHEGAESAAEVEPEEPARKTRNIRKLTDADMLKAAEEQQLAVATVKPRSTKELVKYLDTFIEEHVASDAVNFARDLKKFIARRLTEDTMTTKLEAGYAEYQPGKVLSKAAKKR